MIGEAFEGSAFESDAYESGPVGSVRSLIGFWYGGLQSDPAVVTQGGYRSILGFWYGGLTAVAGAAPDPGWRSVLGFWYGGLTGDGTTPPTGDPTEYVVTYRRRRRS